MTITVILVFAAAALFMAVLSLNKRFPAFRVPLLLIASVLAVYWLQPALPIRGLDFWLPTAMILFSCAAWALTTPREQLDWKATARTGLLILAVVIAIALTRIFSASGWITPSRPPQTGYVLMVLAAGFAAAAALGMIREKKKALTSAAIFLILAIFIVLKLPPLTQAVAGLLRALSGQSAELASALDLRWLGFSYIAFRMIHTLRDRQNGRLPAVTLQEYLVYLFFFPALSAGPIDRIERFIKELRSDAALQPGDLGEGARRLVIGLFKKFVLADCLAIFALNSTHAAQVQSTGWTWVMLYAYTLQIYFDFSGYTDIALGIARWMGFRLPENFNHPYLKPNLTQFWNNWHMTLTQWFRAYFFNPLTRSLRSRKNPVPVGAVIFITQLSTMVLIGLWHGMTWNFVLWGAWHGLGMYTNNRWTDWMKPRSAAMDAHPGLQRVLKVISTFFTFNYVALGWVWFALPSVPLSLTVFARLFGLAG